MHTHLNPYLSFKDNAREAMQFYQSVFGGDLHISTFADYGSSGPEPGMENNVMHATLIVDGKSILMASDGGDGETKSNVSMSLMGSNAEELHEYWDKLSTDGTITGAMEKQVWGDEFGSCLDKFGVHWLINISQLENTVNS
ncbi:MAG: VOC family protein [Herpetosiphon sp.]|nr:VOC family protein [Herpetosiphon sp.]